MSYSFPPDPQRRSFSRGQIVLLVNVVLLLILTSALLAYTAIKMHTDASHAGSIATPQGRASIAAYATTVTAQAYLTATQQPNATATSIAQATAHAKASATVPISVTSTAEAKPTAITQTIGGPDPYSSYNGKLVISDPLADNSQGHGWDVYSLTGNNICQFVGGAYESTTEWIGNNALVANNCIAENTNFSDFTFTAQITIIKGSCAGIVFRATSKTSSQYEFVTCLQDGFWGLRWAKNGLIEPNIMEGYSTAIHNALGQMNVMAVVAIGQTITLYANGQKLGTGTSSIFSVGQIGLDAPGDEGNMNVAMFRNVEVWVH